MELLTNKGKYLGLLTAISISGWLTLAYANGQDESQNSADTAYLAVANEACPYPPETPANTGANNGANADQPNAVEPPAMIMRPLRNPVRPAIYVELLMDMGESANAKISI
jgi:hypothetical protein